jgi:hypothetical protein
MEEGGVMEESIIEGRAALWLGAHTEEVYHDLD